MRSPIFGWPPRRKLLRISKQPPFSNTQWSYYFHTEFTANVSITATTEATANTIITSEQREYDGATLVEFEFWFPRAANPAQQPMYFSIWELGPESASAQVLGTIGLMYFNNAGGTGTENGNWADIMRFRKVPRVGRRTFSVRSYVGSGTGTVVASTGGSGAAIAGYFRAIPIMRVARELYVGTGQ